MPKYFRAGILWGVVSRVFGVKGPPSRAANTSWQAQSQQPHFSGSELLCRSGQLSTATAGSEEWQVGADTGWGTSTGESRACLFPEEHAVLGVKCLQYLPVSCTSEPSWCSMRAATRARSCSAKALVTARRLSASLSFLGGGSMVLQMHQIRPCPGYAGYMLLLCSGWAGTGQA